MKTKENKNMECPFEKLRRINPLSGERNKSFSEDIVKNWYVARAYVLDKIKNITFLPNSKEHLHVVIEGDSPRMLSLARQVALSAHYINFKEDAENENDYHRTVLTIVSNNPNIRIELEKEEYLCNLPQYCKFVYKSKIQESIGAYIDIEIHIVEDCPKEEEKDSWLFFYAKEVDEYFDHFRNDDNTIFSIDTRKAVFTSRIYKLGDVIGNLPAENIHSPKRYVLALNAFQYVQMRKPMNSLINNEAWDSSQARVREDLSNLFCSDCFRAKYLAMKKCWENEMKKPKEARDKTIKNEDFLWEKHIETLSRCEHARWVVEKLVMGYRPLNEKELIIFERKFGDDRKNYTKKLKQDTQYLAHIDLCSYKDLRRINPDDLKYDSFLMLAIPKILEVVKEND